MDEQHPVLFRCGLPPIFTLLHQRKLQYLGHFRRLKDGRIPKNVLYGELIAGKLNLGHRDYAISMCASEI